MLFRLVMLLIGVALVCLMYYCYFDTHLLLSAKLRKGNVFKPVCHSVRRGVCVVGDVHSRGMAGGRAWWGGMRGSRDGHCGGRYASYWNAFLYLLAICVDSNTYLTTNL